MFYPIESSDEGPYNYFVAAELICFLTEPSEQDFNFFSSASSLPLSIDEVC